LVVFASVLGIPAVCFLFLSFTSFLSFCLSLVGNHFEWVFLSRESSLKAAPSESESDLNFKDSLLKLKLCIGDRRGLGRSNALASEDGKNALRRRRSSTNRAEALLCYLCALST